MPKPDDAELLEIDGHAVRISSPSKPYFTRGVHLSKLDIVRYFLSVAPGALRPIVDRPIVLKRFVNGACLESGQPEPFYQKRAPSDLPAFMRTVTLSFPSGRTADEVVVDSTAGLAWIVNLGCMELHPHPVRTADLDHPDELRVDLDPQPGVEWADVRTVSMEIKAILDELNLVAWPKTSGSRGMHINIRIQPRWTFTEVRRAALALARAVEKRCSLASSKWWKEERHGVFIDYNQNAKDRTTCSAYSVRPLPDARVSTPLHWDEVLTCNPADFTVLTVPDRFTKFGDPHAAMDQHPGTLDALLEMAARDETEGLGDAPWPPHFSKQTGEGRRVAPSRAKKFSADSAKESSEASTQESSEDSPKNFSDQFAEGFGAHRFRKQSQKKSSASTDASADAESTTDSTAAPTKRKRSAPSAEASPDAATPKPKRTGRVPKMPLITIAQSPDKAAAEAGLDRWKSAHPEAAAHLAPDDILVDRMRGSSQIWYRIRINLRNVPEDLRPPQTTPDPDDDPTRAWRESHDTKPPSS